MFHDFEIYDFNMKEDVEVTPLKLYNLKPISKGSGKEMESLSSYLQRIAVSHCLPLSKLLSNLFHLQIKDDFSNGKVYSSHRINGNGDLTKITVKLLSEYTGRNDLKKLTLISTENLLSGHKLFRQQKAWCPVCLQEMVTSTLPIYEKLIWVINHYDYCVQHSVKLHDKCNKCMRYQKILPFKGKPGHCSNWNSWLGEMQNNYSGIFQEEIFHKSIQIEKLLDWVIERGNLNQYSFASSIRTIIQEVEKNLWKRKADFYNKELKISHSEMLRYAEGSTPTLGNILKISSVFKLDVIDLLQNNQINEFPLNFKIERLPTQEDSEMKHYLEEVLIVGEIISLSILSRIMRLEEATLCRRFPELTRKIVKKNREIAASKFKFSFQCNDRDSTNITIWLEKALNSRQITPLEEIAQQVNIPLETLRKKYRIIINRISEKNKIIRRENYNRDKRIIADLWEYLDGDIYVEPEVIANEYGPILRSVKYSYLWRKVQEKVKKSIEPKDDVEEADIDSFQIALLEIVELNNDNPPSVNSVCKALGKSRSFLMRHYPILIDIIYKKNKEAIERNRILTKLTRQEQLRETIMKIYSQGIYPSISKIQKEFNLNPYDKVLMNVWRETLKELGITIQISR
ncbi:TniQ family protein [Peribacillus sp. NPDC096540]|uniref:TniQ family protein n=1 Tax=Peribacillus sp. NPDC096540 TaxID=3390612 RepID=UPI003D04AA53